MTKRASNIGRPPVWSVSWRMSGRVRPDVRAEELRHRRVGELLEVLGQLLLVGAPREVGVGLAEPDLGQAVHHLRPGERLGQEERLRVRALELADAPTPRTGTPWCAGCRPGRSRRRARSRTRRSSTARATGSASPRTRSRTGRCPGISSAGSRRTGPCRRGAARNQVGCSRTNGWSGETWKAMSSATRMPRARAASTSASKSSIVPEVRVDGRVSAVRPADRPGHARVVGPGARHVVRRPCGTSSRSGGSAAGTGRRSRAPARTRGGR